MIEMVEVAQVSYLKARPEETKKKLGQYFTNKEISNYMASMIQPIKASVVRILDAGSGAGILTISASLRCLSLGNKHVHAVLYEIDVDAIPQLEHNMLQLKKIFHNNKAEFTFEIKSVDFVLSRPDKTEKPFHLSSINPPYFKYNSKTSDYANVTEDLYKGNPNIYASFMAIVSSCLEPNGQMIAIVPRSFTNGLYFQGFRKFLNKTLSLERVHIFKSRNQVFKDVPVLQENIICSYKKRRQKSSVEIVTSFGCKDLKNPKLKKYPSEMIIDTSTQYELIRVPETEQDAEIIKIVEGWPSSFLENGYFISTGPVVEHRARQYISDAIKNINNVPLFRMHNIKTFKVEWTGDHKKDARFFLLPGYEKHVTDSKIYLFLKRFSSKDESRRLVAGVYSPKGKNTELIAIENHLNYIGLYKGKLHLNEAYGLSVLFNSTLLDRYFRCVSGNTQVNATEIRLLKLPSREVIHEAGKIYSKLKNIDQKAIDKIVEQYLLM